MAVGVFDLYGFSVAMLICTTANKIGYGYYCIAGVGMCITFSKFNHEYLVGKAIAIAKAGMA